MKPQCLLRVERPVVEFEPLIAAVRHEGGRVGWLEWPEDPEPAAAGAGDGLSTPAVTGALGAAARAGAMRAVSLRSASTPDGASPGTYSIAVKPLFGPPVLGDVLREHFRGCALVLIQGPVDAPRLMPRNGDWGVGSGDVETPMTTSELVAALRKRRPFAPAAAARPDQRKDP
ncbi:MAG: hypothetical protein AAGN66_18710 [Acidobacteriota bacterium]